MRVFIFLLLLLSCEQENHPMVNNTTDIIVGKNGLNCSAFKWSDEVLITSAHCVPDNHGNRVRQNGRFKSALSIVVHPNWDAQEVRYDIALIFLAKPKAQEDVELYGQMLIPGELLETVVIEKSGKKVVKKHKVDLLDQDRFAAIDTADAVCKGNSGSPGYLNIEGQFVLVGILSGITKERNDCNNGGKTIFADISFLKDWIIQEMNQFVGN